MDHASVAPGVRACGDQTRSVSSKRLQREARASPTPTGVAVIAAAVAPRVMGGASGAIGNVEPDPKLDPCGRA